MNRRDFFKKVVVATSIQIFIPTLVRPIWKPVRIISREKAFAQFMWPVISKSFPTITAKDLFIDYPCFTK